MRAIALILPLSLLVGCGDDSGGGGGGTTGGGGEASGFEHEAECEIACRPDDDCTEEEGRAEKLETCMSDCRVLTEGETDDCAKCVANTSFTASTCDYDLAPIHAGTTCGETCSEP